MRKDIHPKNNLVVFKDGSIKWSNVFNQVYFEFKGNY